VNIILPPGWPRPKGYSNGIVTRGRLIFVAGQVGWDPMTERIESELFSEQFWHAIRNVRTVLEAGGAKPEHVVRLVWYITDRDEYLAARSAVGGAYRDIMGNHFPAMSVIVVSGLVEARAKVEIEATAVIPE
jgi:enamine deaminase RidA (YjgF/YER057c/UK114 family)